MKNVEVSPKYVKLIACYLSSFSVTFFCMTSKDLVSDFSLTPLPFRFLRPHDHMLQKSQKYPRISVNSRLVGVESWTISDM